MPDPAFLMLLHHLNRSPPAIMQAAPAELSVPSIEAYARYVSVQERELNEWISHGISLRSELWSQVESGVSGLTQSILSDMVDRFEIGLRQEARLLARIEKRARRDEKYLEGSERTAVSRLHRNLITLGQRFYDEGRDFAAFLRALRAEMDTDSRGGRGYDDPETLERSLLLELRQT